MAASIRPRRRSRRRLDRRAALAVAIGGIAVVSAIVAAWTIQASRARPALLAMADRLAHDRPPQLNLAGRYVDAYLLRDPDDPRALALRAEILAEAASTPEGLLLAIEAGDRARRVDPSREDVRRRLLDCYLRLRRAGAALPHHEKAARQLAEGLAFRGEGGIEAHRLAARVLAEMAPEGDPAATDGAIGHYREVLRDEPGDVESARALTGLLFRRKDDPGGASRVLDDLLRANPSTAARIARFRHWRGLDPEDKSGRAAAELAGALERDPRNVDLRLVAADDAIRGGRAEAARRHLDAIDKAGQDDPRVWRARGRIGLIEEHADEAVDDWRRGLVLGGGGDSDLAWRIAFILLNLGRTRDAAPLLARIDALDGRDAPGSRFLRAFRDLKEGRPMAAIDALSLLEVQAPPGLVPLTSYSLGLAFEATRDDSPALAAFERAVRGLPTDPTFRLAMIRMLRVPRPERADVELRKALAADPKVPALWAALARAELDRQARRPAVSRDWSAFGASMANALKMAPASGALALVEADSLALRGLGDRAVPLLNASIRIDRRAAPLRASLGLRLADRGDLDDALLALERGAEPENAGDRVEIRSARARILALRGLWTEAKDAIVGNLDRLPTPGRPEALAAWGDLLRARGDDPGALSAYLDWARLLPEDPNPRLLLLNLALDEGGPDVDRSAREALGALDAVAAARRLYVAVGRAIDLLRDPREPEAIDRRSGRLARVEAAIAEVARIAPDCRWIAILKGRLGEARGRWDEAIAAYGTLLGRDGEWAALGRLTPILAGSVDDGPREGLAAIRPDLAVSIRRRTALEALARGEVDRAASMLEGGIGDRSWRARFLELLGRFDAAEAILRGSIESDPIKPGPWLDLIAFRARIGRSEAARASAGEVASQVEAAHPELFSAECRLRAGDFDAAVVEFDEALDRSPDDPAIALKAADGFLEAGRLDRAEAALRRAISLRPRPRRAVRMLAVLVAGRAPIDKVARDESRLLIGPGSGDDGPEDRLARDLILSRAGDEAGRSAASSRFAARLADLPAISGALRRLGPSPTAEALALGIEEGGAPGDRLRFAESILDAESARDPFAPGRAVREAEVREEASRIDEGGGDAREFLDRGARTLSGSPPRSARFLDARGALLGGLGRLDESLVDLRTAADRARGRAIEPVVLFHLARTLALRGELSEARATLDHARRLGLDPESLGPAGPAEIGAVEARLR